MDLDGVAAVVEEVGRLRVRVDELLAANNAELERRREADRILDWLERKGVHTALRPGERVSGVHFSAWGGQRVWCAHQVGSEFPGLREAVREAMAWEEAHRC